MNPYVSPQAEGGPVQLGNEPPVYAGNRLALVGMCVSATALVGFGLVVMTSAIQEVPDWVGLLGIALCILSPLGTALSAIALQWAPRRLAIWGIIVGALATSQLPTVLLVQRWV